MNRIILIGNLTKDLEERTTANGKQVVNGSIAVARQFKREGQPETDFFNFVLFGKNAENAVKYLAKGSKVGLVGSVQNRSWDKPDGTKGYTSDVFVDSIEYLNTRKADGAGSGATKAAAPSAAPTAPAEADDLFAEELEGFEPMDDAELPF